MARRLQRKTHAVCPKFADKSKVFDLSYKSNTFEKKLSLSLELIEAKSLEIEASLIAF